ncbi:hypothetical protein M9H77_18518 [Catharanthus roseus]|uniref:Uncharacterized protein n=1 Tax=Catharanthus roseus TaxID=4058 RepID=A0ACC0B7P5_CATRO|nr:hypothetical protein M9H77_18518 [Catharanthus roseus]
MLLSNSAKSGISVWTLEDQLKEKEAVQTDLRALVEATDFERAKAESNLEAKVGELACTAKLITSQSRIDRFLAHFPETPLYRYETSCHLVVPTYEAWQRYRDLGHIYVTNPFNGWQALPAVIAYLGYLAESSDDHE